MNEIENLCRHCSEGCNLYFCYRKNSLSLEKDKYSAVIAVIEFPAFAGMTRRCVRIFAFISIINIAHFCSAQSINYSLSNLSINVENSET